MIDVVSVSFFVLLISLADLNLTLIWLLPISWNNLANIDAAGISNYLTIDFVCIMYITMNIVLVIIAVLVGKRQNVEVHMVT